MCLCADVRVFLLGRGRRDDGADGIVIGDVHRGRRGAAATDGDADDGNTANDDDVIGNANGILC